MSEHFNMKSREDAIVYLNGEYCQAKEAHISPFDHGLLYGDGAYDTATAKDGVVFILDEHIERFNRSARALDIDIPLSNEELKEAIVETVKRNNLKDAYIKWLVTRGDGEPFVSPWLCEKPTLLILARGLQKTDTKQPQKGSEATIVSTRRIPPMCGIEPRIKQLNYLNHVMMYMEARAAGADEAIALDINGYVSEFATANLFIVKDDEIYTPPSLNILEGTTRKIIIEIANDLGRKIDESLMTPYDLFTADEIFSTATASGGGLIPIVKVDGRKIGDGKPGNVFKELKKVYLEMLGNEEFGVSIYK